MCRAGVGVLAVVTAASAADGSTSEDLTYAKVKLLKTFGNGTEAAIEQMSGEELLHAGRLLCSCFLVGAHACARVCVYDPCENIPRS